MPGAPQFSDIGISSVTVISPALPANTSSLKLQMKLGSQPASAYADIATSAGDGATTDVDGLASDTVYSFRYVAWGNGGNTEGQSADMRTLTLTATNVTWGPGTAIDCGGIRSPLGGAVIGAGSQIKLSSFLATDFDVRQATVGTQTISTRYSDPCSYIWQVNGGQLRNGVNKGQSVIWFAPTVPGTYTINLTVDDQNAANKPGAEAGSRDDAARGYNDQSLKFSITVTVQ